MKIVLVALAVAAAGFVAPAQAGVTTHEFNFVLTGSQEVPPNTSTAVGAAQLLYRPGDMTFDFDMMVYGITLGELHGVGGNSTPVHIHMAPPGANGGIVVDLGFLDAFEVDGLGIRLQITNALFGGTMGNITSDPATNQAALFAGNLYVNVHTMNFNGGEIRGQIPPIPGPASIGLLGCAALIGTRRRRAA